MRPAPPFDASLGMEYYATDSCPAGGRIKERTEDFVVEEVLADGTVVSLEGVRLQGRVGQWTWIHVVKRDVDTFKLLAALARALGLRPRDVSAGGIKDTRAVASHIVSVKAPPGDLPRLRGVEYRGMWPMDRPITPRDIAGNRFTVVIRGVEDAACMARALEEARASPLPNYYGYQRFGTVRPTSHLLGRALLRKDPEAFLHVMFCTTFPGESEAARRARELACRGEYAKALEAFPRKLLEERVVARRLASGVDPWNAAMSIPTAILRMYLEAYQSYLFNRLLSRRLEMGPLDAPVEGDLVEVGGRAVPAERGEVVLPLVGPGARLPGGRLGEEAVRLLRQEGVSASAFLQLPRRLRLYGSYRRAALRPDWLWARLEGDSAAISFELPRGSYATVVLRELVKPAEPRLHGF